MKRVLAIILSICVVCSLFTGVNVIAQDTTENTSVYEASRITIHPGIDETRLNFSWHSEEKALPATVRIKAQGAEKWTAFIGESKAVATSADGYQEGYHDTFVKNCGHTCSTTCGHEACTAFECYHGIYTDPYYNRVTVCGLEFGVTYTYQLGDGTDWSKEYTTKTADSDPSEDGFEYLVFGDSQTADQYYGDYMKKALELSLDKFPETDFFMNLGDNIHENNDRNYNAYFTAQDVLAQYPMAVVMGNHELNLCTNGDKTNFSDHPALTFTNPPAADSRQDYWFRYGDVLFITFNSGPQLTSMMEDLDQLIKDAKAAHPDVRWTILQTHQGFYANNNGGKVWRKDFTSVLQKYDIDVVFNGHHHLYTRTESLVYDSTLTCSHEKGSPVFDCAACSGSVEPLGENDVTVQETYVASDGVTTTDYNKTVERTDPEGITYIHLDSLTAEGHDQYITAAGASLAATSAFSINTVKGQGAITKVSVTNDELKIETFWINNNDTPRIGNSSDIALLNDDYIEDIPYDTYAIKKTAAVKEVEVTFDGGTDRGIFTKRINAGETVTEPSNPIMTGKSFKYWTADGETAFDFASTLSSDITLTAVYEEIPPTTTAELFVEAVNRGDKEIILKSDITLTDFGAVTIKTGTTIKCDEGERYTITLDTDTRLVTAGGSTVTFENMNITLASTITTQTSGWDSGGYIKVGGSTAKLYIKNCKIHCAASSMGGSNNAIIRPYGNNSSRVYIENSTFSSNANNSVGALIGGMNAIFYVTDSTLKPKASNHWLSADKPTIVFKGTSTYTGWSQSGTKIYNFSNSTVKITRNADNLIELSKIGSGTAVTNDNYKIYYALEDTAFANGTATEYTEPIADIDYETPIFAAIRYIGTSYYGDTNFKVCGEYIEGVAVASSDAFVAAIEGGESLITLIADIPLNNLGNLSIGADTVIQSKADEKFTLTLDGSTRLTVSTGKKATFKSVNIIIAETAEKIDDPDKEAYYYGYITVRNKAKLYIYDSHIEAKSKDLGCSTASMIKIYREDPTNGYVHVERSTVVSPSGQNKGIAFGAIRWTAGTKPTFRIVDSTITGNWVFYQGYHILEGTTAIKGVGYSTSDATIDLRDSSVMVVKTLEGKLELVKSGSGKAVSNEEYKIYYSTDKDAFESGIATQYTAPIEGIDTDTPIYVALGRSITFSGATYTFYGTSTDEILTVQAGDIDEDGSVNATDLASIRNQFLDNLTCDENIIDANRDGEVDARDLVHLKIYIANLS